MWLKIFYDKDDIPEWRSPDPIKVTVQLDFDVSVPVPDDLKSFRVSPIFSLSGISTLNSIVDTKIIFYNFSNAYKVLGRIEKAGSPELKDSVFFSCGLSSVILITNSEEIFSQFIEVSKYLCDASETWEIKDSVIENVTHFFREQDTIQRLEVTIDDYSILPLAERAMIDEFKISIKFLLLKLHTHMPGELDKMQKLIEEMNILVKELVFLESFIGDVPEGLIEYGIEDLKDKKISNMIKHQNLDRIIQVNSALSYVSTQAFSGAIPILERRSLVRRNSLLGIGSAILALNNIARFIESCFSKLPIEDVIKKGMARAAPLAGLEKFYDHEQETWYKSAVSTFNDYQPTANSYFKLPYFNGRLGFRETEYSIAAAIQAVSSGASLEWSLMTVTHEMLHGHVRDIMTFIFYGGDSLKDDDIRNDFYDKFLKQVMGQEVELFLIDSIRYIIFTYCCFSITHGSITVKKSIVADSNAVEVPEKPQLWNVFEREYRNINEIFVHILDLHYFYSSRIAVYIPLIWCSWLAVPYVSGDKRQYILRSLLTIASIEDGTAFPRFNNSIARLKEILLKYQPTKLNHPVISEVLTILGNNDLLMRTYFPAFKTSLMVVDMVSKIFTSEGIRASIFNDERVSLDEAEEIEDSIEQIFKYQMPEGFNDEVIKSPVSYLLDKMIKELNSSNEISDLERETVLQFLALNSN